MTTTPRDDDPDDGPSDYQQPQGYPYYGPPHYGPPPPAGYPHRQWQPPAPPSRISIPMIFGGCAAWAIINVTVALAAILVSSGSTGSSDNVVLGAAALSLAVIAFGVGGGLVAARNRYSKGLGLGLMIGWALTSLFSVGFCTGINPGMYTL